MVSKSLISYNHINVSAEESETTDNENEPKSSPGMGSLVSYNRKLRDSLEEAKANHRKEVRELKNEIRELEVERDALKKSAASFEASLQARTEGWRSERAELEAKFDAIQADLAAKAKVKDDQIEKLTAEIAGLQKSLAKLESREGSLNKLKQSLLEQARNLRSELNEFKSANSELVSQVEALTAERDALAEAGPRLKAVGRQRPTQVPIARPNGGARTSSPLQRASLGARGRQCPSASLGRTED